MAGLLISRQIIGNLRESAIPYFIEQWKLAKLSFAMWGALSPTQDVKESLDSGIGSNESHSNNSQTHPDNRSNASNTLSTSDSRANCSQSFKRNIGQAELESSLCKVLIIRF